MINCRGTLTRLARKGAWFAALIVLVCPRPGKAETYRVGPGQKYDRVSEVADLLRPGDIVEVAGNIEDAFELSVQGTEQSPVTIRGVLEIRDGKAVRPKISIPPGASHGIVCNGGWTVLENLEITGAESDGSFVEGSAVFQTCSNLTIRNCYIHHNRQGVYSKPMAAGSTTIESCEFEANGGVSQFGSNMHSVYLCTTDSDAVAILKHCVFRDATGGGAFFKSRCRRNIVYCNWFENPYNYALKLTGTNIERDDFDETALYPMHSDIVGNVFYQGRSPGPQNALLSLGGEGTRAPGTEGDFAIAHNLFIMTKRLSRSALLVSGNVDHVSVYCNIFMGHGINDWQVYERGPVWESPRTAAFAMSHGRDVILEGANNWISEKAIAASIPEPFVRSKVGDNPCFVDLFGGDWHPKPESPLAASGLPSLQEGRLIDLIPEHEPRREISADSGPKKREAENIPSVGPFAVP